MEKFIGEYKRLEKICSEMYDQEHGVSQYIADMEQTPTSISARIPEWNRDYNWLKRVRHLRNRMVHDTSCHGDEYEPEDLIFLRQFYQRVITRQDPLAYRRRLEVAPVRRPTEARRTETSPQEQLLPTFFLNRGNQNQTGFAGDHYRAMRLSENNPIVGNGRNRDENNTCANTQPVVDRKKSNAKAMAVLACLIVLIICLLAFLYLLNNGI